MTGTSTFVDRLYATQGGGYATYKDGQLVWHSEIPDFLPGAQVGDPIPEEWDFIPIGEAARQQMEDEVAALDLLSPTDKLFEIFDDEEFDDPLVIEDEEDESDDTAKYLSAYSVPARTYARLLRDI